MTLHHLLDITSVLSVEDTSGSLLITHYHCIDGEVVLLVCVLLPMMVWWVISWFLRKPDVGPVYTHEQIFYTILFVDEGGSGLHLLPVRVVNKFRL